MPLELPEPAGKAEPELAANKAILKARGKKGRRRPHDRYRDVPVPASRISQAARDRGYRHMDAENPEIWQGSICEDE